MMPCVRRVLESMLQQAYELKTCLVEGKLVSQPLHLCFSFLWSNARGEEREEQGVWAGGDAQLWVAATLKAFVVRSRYRAHINLFDCLFSDLIQVWHRP